MKCTQAPIGNKSRKMVQPRSPLNVFEEREERVVALVGARRPASMAEHAGSQKPGVQGMASVLRPVCSEYVRRGSMVVAVEIQ
jgi:hypothetical protein